MEARDICFIIAYILTALCAGVLGYRLGRAITAYRYSRGITEEPGEATRRVENAVTRTEQNLEAAESANKKTTAILQRMRDIVNRSNSQHSDDNIGEKEQIECQ